MDKMVCCASLCARMPACWSCVHLFITIFYNPIFLQVHTQLEATTINKSYVKCGILEQENQALNQNYSMESKWPPAYLWILPLPRTWSVNNFQKFLIFSLSYVHFCLFISIYIYISMHGLYHSALSLASHLVIRQTSTSYSSSIGCPSNASSTGIIQ